MEEKVLNYNLILESCGVGSESPQVVMQNITRLQDEYVGAELVSVYNYLLNNIKEPQILVQVIKCSDSNRASSTLAILLELLSENPPDESDTDENINFRVMCIKAIANYKDTSTLTLLLDCMKNKKENYKVRLACADALGRIGDRFAVQPLISLVEDEEEKSVYLKESATFALGMLGDTSAIDPLVSILESKHGFIDKFSFLKEKIVEALGKLNISNRKVLKALKNSLMDVSPMVRINAIEAIMNSGEDDSIELIRPCLNDDDDDVKKNALIAIYNLSGRDILDEVLNLPTYSQFLKDFAQELIDEYEDIEDEE